jgi:hypothetical protein
MASDLQKLRDENDALKRRLEEVEVRTVRKFVLISHGIHNFLYTIAFSFLPRPNSLSPPTSTASFLFYHAFGGRNLEKLTF